MCTKMRRYKHNGVYSEISLFSFFFFFFFFFHLFRVIGKVVNQDAFPDSVLRARADERRGRKVAVDEDSLESAAT